MSNEVIKNKILDKKQIKSVQNEAVLKLAHENVHGIVLRSSGIFYYKKNDTFKTTFSFLNYWKIKNNISVSIICSIRNLDGKLIKREEIKFEKSDVMNYIPSLSEISFEGSVEIEIFSLIDMVIPYAGILVIYESKFGNTMTHTYGRTYSSYEIEEGNTLSKCEETCCHSLLPKNEGKSYLIFHNGSQITPNQEIVLSLLNYLDERIETTINLDSLNPYQTVKIDPSEYFENYYDFLDNNPGNISLSFSLNNTAFPRMLTVNETLDGNDFQVNHSNFNLSKINTPKLENDQYGYMNPVSLDGLKTELVVYPDCEDGEYEVIYKNKVAANFNKNHFVSVRMDSITNNFIKFTKINDNIPLRIHTGMRISKSTERLPSESCHGIWHTQYPQKRFHWLMVAENQKIFSRVVFRSPTDEFNDKKDKKNLPLKLKLYSEKTFEVKDVSINPSELFNGKRLKDIFVDAENFLGDSFGWLTIFSEYPYYEAYGTIENNHGSIAYEHSF